LDLNFSKKPVQCYIWNIAICCNWALREVDQKHLESSEIWCWRRMEIRWTDPVKNEEVSYTVKKDRNILPTIKKEEG
jgi:hypothetical protein